MTNWSIEPGRVKEVLERALKLIRAEDTAILEVHFMREMTDIYEEPGYVAETVPTGVMRLEIRFIGREGGE
jgi:hypothetical protein